MSAPAFPAAGVRDGVRRPFARRPGVAPIALIAAVALASVAAATAVHRSAGAHERASRATRIEVQRLERRLRRLDAPGADDTLAALGESRDALRVRLVEALDRVRERSDRDVFAHRIEEIGTTDDAAVATVRLTVEGRVAHGAALIDLLEAVAEARRPWPGETRGCVVQRVDAGGGGNGTVVGGGAGEGAAPAPLLIRCAVDLLHWRGAAPS